MHMYHRFFKKQPQPKTTEGGVSSSLEQPKKDRDNTKMQKIFFIIPLFIHKYLFTRRKKINMISKVLKFD